MIDDIFFLSVLHFHSEQKQTFSWTGEDEYLKSQTQKPRPTSVHAEYLWEDY